MTALRKSLSLKAHIIGIGFLIFGGTAATANDWQVLRDDSRIYSGLTVVAVGRHIHNVCSDIQARMARALVFAEGLVHHARGLGFSRAEINAYIDDPTEQEFYRQVARQYFAQQGADYDDAVSVCRVGRDEIATGSQIGRLLRAR